MNDWMQGLYEAHQQLTKQREEDARRKKEQVTAQRDAANEREAQKLKTVFQFLGLPADDIASGRHELGDFTFHLTYFYPQRGMMQFALTIDHTRAANASSSFDLPSSHKWQGQNKLQSLVKDTDAVGLVDPKDEADSIRHRAMLYKVLTQMQSAYAAWAEAEAQYYSLPLPKPAEHPPGYIGI